MMTRRSFLGVSAVGVSALARAQQPAAISALKPMTAGVRPITVEERRARLEKARRLMAEQKIGAVYMERGSSMFYFTGARDLSGILIPARGEIAWIVPANQEPRVQSAGVVGGTAFTYADADGPFGAIKQALKDR